MNRNLQIKFNSKQVLIYIISILIAFCILHSLFCIYFIKFQSACLLPDKLIMTTEVYQTYQVSNVQYSKWYYKWGCLVSQMDKYIGTHLAILFSMILYYIVTASHSNTGLIVMSVILHILTTFILIVLAYKDPGIMPKILNNYQNEQNRHIPIPTGYLTGQVQNSQQLYQVTTKTHLLRLKFCNYCYIYRPPRTSHCYECNVCIQRYDHHCPWIGSCVGKRNYKWFFNFLISLALLQLFLLIQILIIIVQKNSEVSVAVLVLNIILGIVVILSMLFVYILLGFHIYFSLYNVTTYQFCKKSWQAASGNPFKKSQFLKNISKIFVSPNTKKYKPNLVLKDRQQLQKQKDFVSSQKNSQKSIDKQGKKPRKRKTGKSGIKKEFNKDQESQTERSVQLKPASSKNSLFQHQ